MEQQDEGQLDEAPPQQRGEGGVAPAAAAGGAEPGKPPSVKVEGMHAAPSADNSAMEEAPRPHGSADEGSRPHGAGGAAAAATASTRDRAADTSVGGPESQFFWGIIFLLIFSSAVVGFVAYHALHELGVFSGAAASSCTGWDTIVRAGTRCGGLSCCAIYCW